MGLQQGRGPPESARNQEDKEKDIKKSLPTIAAIGLTTTLLAQTAGATTVQFADPSGLSAQATFALLNGGSTLQIALKNTSSSVPAGYGSSDHLLTSIAFNLNGTSIIKAGSAVHIGAASQSLGFSSGFYGPGSNVSGEFGFGNGGTTGFGSHPNFVSAMQAGTTRFNGANLDGPAGLNGPQAGLVSAANAGQIGGQGAIRDEVIITINLNAALADLSFLSNGARVEFGSDRLFLDGTMTVTLIPLPGVAGMAGLGLVLVGSRRRR